MATFLNFQWQEVEPKYLNPLLSYLNLNSGLNLPEIFDHILEILVQVNKAVLVCVYCVRVSILVLENQSLSWHVWHARQALMLLKSLLLRRIFWRLLFPYTATREVLGAGCSITFMCHLFMLLKEARFDLIWLEMRIKSSSCRIKSLPALCLS